MKIKIPKGVLNNFINLSSIQIITTVVQIMLYPFLIGVLGAQEYGKIVFAQLSITYFQVFVVFGTDLTAVSLVSGGKDQKELTTSFSQVFFGRLLLAFVAIVIYFSGFFYFDIEVIFLFFIFAILEPVFTTRWYYHGRESLSHFSVPLVASRLITSLIIFLLVDEQGDRDLVIVLLSVGYFLGVLIPFVLLHVSGVRLVKVKAEEVYKLFINSSRLFFTNILSIAKDRTSGIIIGLAISFELLAFYEFTMRIANVISSFLASFSASFYPGFCKKFDVELYRKASKVVFLLSILPLTFLILFPTYIVFIINFIMDINLNNIADVFYFFGILIFVRGHAHFIGLCCLMANKQEKSYTSTLIYSSLLFFLLVVLLVILDELSMELICLIYSVSLLFEYIHRFYKCKQYLKRRYIESSSI